MRTANPIRRGPDGLGRCRGADRRDGSGGINASAVAHHTGRWAARCGSCCCAVPTGAGCGIARTCACRPWPRRQNRPHGGFRFQQKTYPTLPHSDQRSACAPKDLPEAKSAARASGSGRFIERSDFDTRIQTNQLARKASGRHITRRSNLLCRACLR